PHARLPDASLNQILVAANHIEGLTRQRPLKKNSRGKTSPVGGSVDGPLSVNTGRPYDPGDVRFVEDLLRLYLEDGITDFAEAWQSFSTDAPDLALSLTNIA